MPLSYAERDFDDSTGYAQDAGKLQEIMSESGYVFIRNLIARETIEAANQDCITILKEYGFVGNSVIQDPIWSGKKSTTFMRFDRTIDQSTEMVSRITALKSIEGVTRTRDILDVAEKIMGTRVAGLPRNHEHIRVQLPGKEDEYATFAHCDGVAYPRTDRFLQVWLPLAPIPKSTGGLAILPASHRQGPMAYYSRNLAKLGTPLNRNQLYEWIQSGAVAINEGPVPDESVSWRRSDYALGDVLFFHMYTQHRGMPNSSDRIRLSIDPRYVPETQPLSWKERVSLAEYNSFYEEAKCEVRELGVSGGIADKILHVMSIEGPSTDGAYTIRSRIKTLEGVFGVVMTPPTSLAKK